MEFTKSWQIIEHRPYGDKYRVEYTFDDSDEKSLEFVYGFKDRIEKSISSDDSAIKRGRVGIIINGTSSLFEFYSCVSVKCEPVT